VLRRRHFAQTQAAREAKRRKEAHEARGPVDIPQEAFLAVLKVDEIRAFDEAEASGEAAVPFERTVSELHPPK
jgi:hypothetical protein